MIVFISFLIHFLEFLMGGLVKTFLVRGGVAFRVRKGRVAFGALHHTAQPNVGVRVGHDGAAVPAATRLRGLSCADQFGRQPRPGCSHLHCTHRTAEVYIGLHQSALFFMYSCGASFFCKNINYVRGLFFSI